MKLFYILIAISLSVSSCRRSDRDLDNSLLATADEVNFQMHLSQLFLITDEAAQKVYDMIPNTTSGLLNCATINSNTLGSPNSLEINYGTACLGSDNRTRKGKLSYTLEGNYADSGSIVLLTFNNFYIDNLKFTGRIRFTWMGQNEERKSQIKHEYKDVLVQSINPNTTARISGSGSRTLVSDDEPFDVSDNVYEITGKSNSISKSGNAYSAEITTPIHFSNDCKYPTQGSMTIEPSNLLPRYARFGEQACDSSVIVVISETQHLIILD